MKFGDIRCLMDVTRICCILWHPLSCFRLMISCDILKYTHEMTLLKVLLLKFYKLTWPTCRQTGLWSLLKRLGGEICTLWSSNCSMLYLGVWYLLWGKTTACRCTSCRWWRSTRDICMVAEQWRYQPCQSNKCHTISYTDASECFTMYIMKFAPHHLIKRRQAAGFVVWKMDWMVLMFYCTLISQETSPVVIKSRFKVHTGAGHRYLFSQWQFTTKTQIQRCTHWSDRSHKDHHCRLFRVSTEYLCSPWQQHPSVEWRPKQPI